MSRLQQSLRETFSDEESRYAYAEAHLNASIASQLKKLRGDMSQQELAEKLGTKQSGISRLENANYSSWKVETLRKAARVFGVRLRISFEEFGTLVPEIEIFGKRLRPRRFEEDPVFQELGTNKSAPEELPQSAMRTFLAGAKNEEVSEDPILELWGIKTYGKVVEAIKNSARPAPKPISKSMESHPAREQQGSPSLSPPAEVSTQSFPVEKIPA
jgi:transcriptional regulator with XRE-family HTH domain